MLFLWYFLLFWTSSQIQLEGRNYLLSGVKFKYSFNKRKHTQKKYGRGGVCTSYIEAVKDEVWNAKAEVLLRKHSAAENKML